MNQKIIIFFLVLSFSVGCGKKADKLISTLKNDTSPEKRYEAAIELGKLKTEKAVTPLLKSYEIEDNYVRTGILKALAEIGAPQTLDFLIKEYNDTQYNTLDMRLIALKGLGNYKGNSRAISIIKEAIDDNDFRIREQAIRSFGAIMGDAGVKYLVELLDIRAEHEKAIVETLGNIGSKLSTVALSKQFEKKLEYESGSDFIKYYAEAFVKIGDNRFIRPLIKAWFDRKNTEIRKIIIDALEKLNISHKYAQVLASILNFRTQPTIRAEITDKVSKGEILKILKQSKLQFILDNQKDYWYLCETSDGKKGWVFGVHLMIFDMKEEKSKL